MTWVFAALGVYFVLCLLFERQDEPIQVKSKYEHPFSRN